MHLLHTLQVHRSIRDLTNSKFGLFYSNFFILTPTFSKMPIEKYGKTPIFSDKQHFYSYFQIPSENSESIVEGTRQHFVWPWPQGQIMYYLVNVSFIKPLDVWSWIGHDVEGNGQCFMWPWPSRGKWSGYLQCTIDCYPRPSWAATFCNYICSWIERGYIQQWAEYNPSGLWKGDTYL